MLDIVRLILLSTMACSALALLYIAIAKHRSNKVVIQVSKSLLLHSRKYMFAYKHSLFSKRLFMIVPHIEEPTFYVETRYYGGKRDGTIIVYSKESREEVLNINLYRIKDIRFEDPGEPLTQSIEDISVNQKLEEEKNKININ